MTQTVHMYVSPTFHIRHSERYSFVLIILYALLEYLLGTSTSCHIKSPPTFSNYEYHCDEHKKGPAQCREYEFITMSQMNLSSL